MVDWGAPRDLSEYLLPDADDAPFVLPPALQATPQATGPRTYTVPYAPGAAIQFTLDVGTEPIHLPSYAPAWNANPALLGAQVFRQTPFGVQTSPLVIGREAVRTPPGFTPGTSLSPWVIVALGALAALVVVR